MGRKRENRGKGNPRIIEASGMKEKMERKKRKQKIIQIIQRNYKTMSKVDKRVVENKQKCT